jgi:hypothetical protein
VFKEIQTKNQKSIFFWFKDQQQQGLPFTLIKLKKGHFITIPYFLENTKIIWEDVEGFLLSWFEYSQI